MSSILVLSGGGIGSAVAAARFARDHSLTLLHVDYGQAAAVAEHRALVAQMPSFAQTRLMRLTLPHVLELNRGSVEHAKPGVVHSPVRGADNVRHEDISTGSLRGLFPVLLSVGFQAALRIGAEALVVGVTRGSATHVGLPGADQAGDLRREFFHAFATACDALLGKNRAVGIEAPLLDLTPAQVAQLGLRLEAPLTHTWSCMAAGAGPCQRCAGCNQREAAFSAIGRPDPLLNTSGATR